MVDIAELGIRIDSSGVKKATKDLDQMADSSRKLEQSTDSVGKASEKASAEVDRFGNALTDADKEMGRFIDKSGKMREKNGQFVKGMREAAIAAGTYSEEVKEGAKRTVDLSSNLPAVANGALKIAAAMAAAATAAAGLVAVVGEQVKENDDLAKSLGISTTKLQQFQAVAKTVGLTAEDMGGILSDASEKIGDFLTNDGGEAEDIFENLAVSAKDLQNLDPADQLRAIGKALQDVESRSEQIFFLESLGSDAKLLLPLLTDNTEELDRLLDKSLETGAALSSFDNTALIQASEGFEDMGNAISGASRLLAAEMSPAVILVQEKVEQMIAAFDKDDIESFVEFGVDAIGVLLDVIQTYEMAMRLSAVSWTRIAAAATGAMAESADAVAGLVNFALKPLLVVLENVAEGWSIITGALADITPGTVSDGFRSASESLASFSDQVANFTVTSGDIKDANEAVNKSLQEQIQALDDLANSPAYSEQFKANLKAIRKEIEAKAVADEKARKESLGLATQTEKTAAEIDAEAKAKAKAAEEAKKLAAKNKDAAERFKDLVRPVRAVIREYEEAKRLFDKGLLSEEDFKATKKRLGGIAAELGGLSDEAGGAGEKTGFEFAEALSSSLERQDFTSVGAMIGEQIGGEVGSAIGAVIGSLASDSQSDLQKAGTVIGTAIGAYFGGAKGATQGAQAGSAIGGLLTTSKQKIGEGFDVNIVSNTIAEAFSTKTIKKTSLWNKRTTTYRKAVDDATIGVIQNTFDAVSDGLSDTAKSLGAGIGSFTGEIKIKNGDLNAAISEFSNQSVEAAFGALEDFRLIGEQSVQTFGRLASDAELVGDALSAIDLTIDGAGDIEAQTQEFKQIYTDQFEVLFSRREEIAVLDQALKSELEGLDGAIAGRAIKSIKGELRSLFKEAAALDDELAEFTSRFNTADVEAVSGFTQSLLSVVDDLTGVGIESAGAELNRLTANYSENFFSASEQVESAIESAVIDLEKFSSIGVTTETSFETLRDSIERFKDSDTFTPEGLARYLAAASALSVYSESVTDQANLLKAEANAIEDSNSIIESSLAKLEETIDTSSVTVEGAQSGQDLPGIMAGIKDEFRGVINFIGGMRVSAEELEAAYNSATTAGLTLVEPLSDTGIQIAQVYQDVLGRLPDQGGLDFWKSELESGALSFQQFFDLVTTSDEAKLKDRFDGLLGAFNAYDAIAKLPPPPVEPVQDVVDIITSVADIGLSERDLGRLRDLLDTLRGVSEQDRALENLNLTADGIDEFLSVIGGIGQTPENLAALADGLGLSVNEFVDSVETIAEAVKETAVELFDFAAQVDRATSDAERAVAAESDRLTDSYQDQIDAIRGTQEAEEDLSDQRKDAARSTISNLKDIQRLLKSSASAVRASSLEIDMARQQAASSRIGAIIAGGTLPGSDELESLLGDLTNISEDQFRTQEDFAFAQAVAANQIKALEQKTVEQLSVEEKTLLELEDGRTEANESADRQIELLIEERDNAIAANQAQLDALLGIDDSVMSVADALVALSNSISQLQASQSVGSFSESKIISQVGSGSGVSTVFQDPSGSIGVIDTGAFNQPLETASAQASGVDLTPAEIAAVLGLPAFASGGDHSGGPMLVGENGAEIVNTGPSRIFNAAETSAMMNPADLYRQPVTIDVSSIVNKISGLEATMSGLLTSISISSNESANILDDFQVDGIRINTDDEPVSVNQV